MDWNAQGGSGPAVYEDFLVPAMFRPFAELLVADAGVAEGDHVLDIACGTGIVARLAAHAAGPTGAVTGVDLGPPMLAVAREQAGPEGSAPIEYLEGSADALPVPDAAFDVATIHHGLQFFPDRAAALRDARRALKPGGGIAIGCWASSVGFQILDDALERHISLEAAEMMRSPFSVSREDLERLLGEAGFSDIRTSAPTLTTTFDEHAEFAPRALAAGPIAPMFAAASDEARAAVTTEVAAALEPYASDGRVSYEMTSNVAIATA